MSITGRIDLQDVSARACFFSLILSLRNSASFLALEILSAISELIVGCASVGVVYVGGVGESIQLKRDSFDQR